MISRELEKFYGFLQTSNVRPKEGLRSFLFTLRTRPYFDYIWGIYNSFTINYSIACLTCTSLIGFSSTWNSTYRIFNPAPLNGEKEKGMESEI